MFPLECILVTVIETKLVLILKTRSLSQILMSPQSHTGPARRHQQRRRTLQRTTEEAIDVWSVHDDSLRSYCPCNRSIAFPGLCSRRNTLIIYHESSIPRSVCFPHELFRNVTALMLLISRFAECGNNDVSFDDVIPSNGRRT